MNKDESIRFASKYLEDLLSFFGINVAVYSTIEDDVIQLFIHPLDIRTGCFLQHDFV